MATGEKTIQIIANESNTVVEVEAGGAGRHTPEPDTTAENEKASQPPAANSPSLAAQRTIAEAATNDGAVIETLDTAFHNKPGVAEGETVSGSNRADYYESRSQGKSDAEEELEVLHKGEPQ